MATRAHSTFMIKGWDESAFAETDGGGKLTKASVQTEISGDISGQASVEWLMCYRPDQTADFVGLQRVVGQIGDRSGSFVLLHPTGTFDGKEAKGAVSIAPGSGSGGLTGLRGDGTFTAPLGGEPSIELEYELG